MLVSLTVALVSFLVGFAMKRGGLCTYAAVTQMVNEKRIERMMVFFGVAAWATLILLPLHWMQPQDIALSTTHYNLLIAFVGGTVLGIGAFLNKGCFFGTFVALVSGNMNYLSTLVGLSVGVAFTQSYLTAIIPSTAEVSHVSMQSTSAYVWLIGMGMFALFMFISVKLSDDSLLKKRTGLDILNWQSDFAMVTIGLGGALLYATVSGWNYSDVLTNTTSNLIGKQAMGASMMALIATVSMVIGGISAAVMSKEFSLHRIKWHVVLGCFSGGTLMGSASMFIPGGNDGLLLKGIPSLAPHALVGYAFMLLSMLVLVCFFRNTQKS